MYRQICPNAQQPQLNLKAHIEIDGIMLRARVPKELECKVMVAMRNSDEKKCLREGVLEIWFPCLRNHSPHEKARRIIAFCRWLAKRSQLRVAATL